MNFWISVDKTNIEFEMKQQIHINIHSLYDIWF